MMKFTLPCLALLSLFSFSLSAQIDFTEHTIALGGQNYPDDSDVADFDGDGLLDILVYNNGGHRTTSAARQTNHIAWYKNLGNGEYQKHPIPITHVNKAIPYDYDDDGDIDILCSYYYHGSGDPRDNITGIRILINDGTGKFSGSFIDSNRSSEPNGSLDIIDINNDGLMDFIFGFEVEDWDLERVGQDEYEARLTGEISYSKIAFINRGNNDFKPITIGGFSVFRDGGYIGHKSGDLNNDGNLDFGVMIYNNGRNSAVLRTAIYNPIDSTFNYMTLSAEILNDRTPSLFDYDDDGDLDVLQYFILDGTGGGNANRVLYENDGLGNFTEVIIPDFISVPTFYDYPELDIDGDGDLDQIRREYSWHENTGTNYVEHVIDSALIGNKSKIADLDQDGDWDLIVVMHDDDSEDYKKVFLWVNDGNGSYSKQLLEDKNYWMRNFVAADLDGDGDNDLVVTSWVNGELLWYQNDGDQNFTEILIADDQESIIEIKLVDLDTDGDMDFVTTYSIAGGLSWWENDGSGNFSKIPISTNSLDLYEVNIGDYDGDGDMDLVTVDLGNSRILIWANDGNNNFTQFVIYENNFANPIETVDIDQDGDLDIIVGFLESEEVRLLRGDGTGSFVSTWILEDVYPSYLEIIDLDDDGNIDILVSDNYNGKLTWLRNTGSDFVPVVLGDNPYNAQTASADYDGDGDIDIFYQKGFSTSTNATNDLRYLENDGNQNFTESSFDPQFLYGRDLQAFDLDEDGDLDLIGTSVALGFKWYENQLITDPNATVLRVTSCPSDIRIITADNFVKVDWDEPTATTTCMDNNLSFNQVLGANNGSDFPIGTHLIDYEITDKCGNKKACKFNIIIEPEPDPAILTLEFCPQNITELTSSTTAPVLWNEPTATTTCDILDITIIQVDGLPNGSDFPIGTNVITYEISDECNNTTSCSFNVFVEERPAVDCPETLPDMEYLGEVNGHKYFLSNGTDTWRGAQKTARTLGGYLISFNTTEERLFLRDHVNEVVFIGINDADEERTIVWDSGESLRSFEFTGINNEENDFGIFHFWNGTYGFANQYVYKRFVVEIDCDTYQPCSMEAEVSLVQCDDNRTLDNSQDDYFGFQLLVNGYGATTFWKTNLNGTDITGDYNVPTEFSEIPLFAPGQMVTVTVEDADGGCSAKFDLDVPRPCPGTSTCPTEIPGYEFLGRYNGHHYFISTDPSTWLEASNFIKGIDSYLVTINDEAENDFLQSKVSEIAFIGLSDHLEEGIARWTSGTGHVYTNFGTCGICSSNTEENDFSSFNFWDGTWGVDNQWVVRNHIMELECGIGTLVAPRTAKKYTPFTNHLTLFPNPVYQTATVDLEIENDKTEVFRIFNVQNQLVFEQTAELRKGMNRIQFNLRELPSGFYFLKTTGVESALKFIVEANK